MGAAISVDAKVDLLNALSETGLKRIVVGSFVSPKYTPQMARIDEIVQKFRPKPGVTYTALALNEKGVERAKQYSPPLTVERGGGKPRLFVHQCDVFVRRNTNRSHMQEMAAWPKIIRAAREKGATEAGIGTNATFGSNFLGDFTVDMTMKFLATQHELWDAAGMRVTSVSVGDPMGRCHPVKVEEIFGRVKKQWPAITDFRAHLHNSRGMALTSAYAAITTLDAGDTLHLEGTLGGVGGCPYCDNGRATGMAPTEDFMHMLEGMGIETGVDLDKLIECVWMLETMIGRYAWGHVSRCGPRPTRLEQLYDPNFCAGADIKARLEREPQPGDFWQHSRRAREAFHSILECRVPVIAAINGPALGAGLGIAASCDLLIASENATMGLPEINVGLLGGGRHAMRLFSHSKARRLMFTGQRLSGADLYHLGVVEECVPADKLMDAARVLAAEIASKSPIAIRLAKHAMNTIELMSLRDGYRFEQNMTGELSKYEDSREAMRAFVEKRPPVFRGR